MTILDRRSFISAAGIGAVGAAFKRPMIIGGITLPPPVESRITNYTTQPIPHGTQYDFTQTLTGADGIAVEIKAFSHRIELDDAYSQTVFGVYTNEGKVILRANYALVGQKGKVSGNTRSDTIQVTIVEADGTVKQKTLTNVQVPLTLPTVGMPFEEVAALLSKYHSQTFTTGNSQTLLEFLQSNAH